jgi:hypothetical protein
LDDCFTTFDGGIYLLVDSYMSTEHIWTWEEGESEPRCSGVRIPQQLVIFKLNRQDEIIAAQLAAAQDLVDNILGPTEDGSVYTVQADFFNRIKAAMPLMVVYPNESEIPVDRAGRKMYNKYGEKLDIEDRS